jgi:tetratricopeptide (TPR) repeat protein
LIEAWKVLPIKHPWALEVVGDLSWALLDQTGTHCCEDAQSTTGDYVDQAWEWYNWTLSARRAVLGRSHPATMGAVKGIGQVLVAKCMFPEALKEFEKALSLRAYYLGYGDILTQHVIDDVTILFRLWRECEGPGLEQALFEYLTKTKSIREYQLVPLRVDLLRIYRGLKHVIYEIDEKFELTTFQDLLHANRHRKPSDRLPWHEIQSIIVEVAETFDGNVALPLVLSYLEDMTRTILSRSRRIHDLLYMGRPVGVGQDLELQWVVDAASFKLKELGNFEGALDLCQRLLQFLDELDIKGDSQTAIWRSILAFWVSWDIAKTLRGLGRNDEAFKMSDRARLEGKLFSGDNKYKNNLYSIWTETAWWYEEFGRYDIAISLYMELISLSGARGYPMVEREITKELLSTVGRAYHASGDLYKALGWIYLILKKATHVYALGEFMTYFHRDAIEGMFSRDGDQEHQLFSQELRLIVTQGRPHLLGTSFCTDAFDIFPWAEKEWLVCTPFAPSPYASYSRTCPAIYLPAILDRAMIIKEQNSVEDLWFAATGHWSDYV